MKQTRTPQVGRYERERIQVILTVVLGEGEGKGFRPFVRGAFPNTGIYDYNCAGSDSYMFIAHSGQEVKQKVAMIKESVARMFHVWMASKNEPNQPERPTESLELIHIS